MQRLRPALCRRQNLLVEPSLDNLVQELSVKSRASSAGDNMPQATSISPADSRISPSEKASILTGIIFLPGLHVGRDKPITQIHVVRDPYSVPHHHPFKVTSLTDTSIPQTDPADQINFPSELVPRSDTTRS